MSSGTPRRGAVLALLAALPLLVACGGRDDESVTSTTGGAAASPGITETGIKLGGSFPYSGPGAAYGAIGNAAKAYFDSVNDAGGVDGRTIEYELLDDAYDPTKTMQVTRRLVEQDEVFGIFGTTGTATNLATMAYLNRRGVPQIYPTTGAPIFSDHPERDPWTVQFLPTYTAEGAIYAQYLNEARPGARVAVLFQNDDLGKSLLEGFSEAVDGIEIVAQESYELTDPSVASQTTKLARSGADTFVFFTTTKAALQALTTARKLDWRPLRVLNTSSNSIPATLEPFGLAASRGIVSASWLKDPADPQFADDPGIREYLDVMRRHAPREDPENALAQMGYVQAEAVVLALEAMKEPTREAFVRAVRELDTELPLLLPGIRVNPTTEGGAAVQALQVQRFDGRRWVLEGEPITAAER